MRAAVAAPPAYPVALGLGALDATGYSVIVPVAPAIADATGAGPAVIGLLVASFPAAMVAGFALAGWAVRRFGPRPLLCVSLVLAALGALGFVLGDSLAVYFPARALMGLGSGGLWIGVMFDTIDRWPGQEYLCMSRVYAAYSVGGLLGPALGALGGIQAPFLAYLALLLAALPAVLLVAEPPARRAFGSGRSALRGRGFWVAAAAIMFASVSLGVVEGVLPLHFADGLGQVEIAALYVGASLVLALSAWASGTLPRPGLLVLVAAVLAVAGITAAGAAGAVPLWVAALLVASAGVGLANTGSLGLLVEAVPLERIVTAMVVWSQVGIVGYLLGPVMGGLVAEGPGYAYLGIVPAAAALLAVALTRTGKRGPDGDRALRLPS